MFASEFHESCALYRFEHADESGDGILDMEDNFMGTVWQNVGGGFQYDIHPLATVFIVLMMMLMMLMMLMMMMLLMMLLMMMMTTSFSLRRGKESWHTWSLYRQHVFSTKATCCWSFHWVPSVDYLHLDPCLADSASASITWYFALQKPVDPSTEFAISIP